MLAGRHFLTIGKLLSSFTLPQPIVDPVLWAFGPRLACLFNVSCSLLVESALVIILVFFLDLEVKIKTRDPKMDLKKAANWGEQLVCKGCRKFLKTTKSEETNDPVSEWLFQAVISRILFIHCLSLFPLIYSYNVYVLKLRLQIL